LRRSDGRCSHVSGLFARRFMAAGPDVIRGSGPNQMSAVYAASAWSGLP
jgi:hypothetical protein